MPAWVIIAIGVVVLGIAAWFIFKPASKTTTDATKTVQSATAPLGWKAA